MKKNICVIMLAVLAVCAGCKDSEKASEIYSRALAKFYQKELKEAEALFVEVLEHDGGFVNALVMLSKISFYNKEYTGAAGYADRVLKQSPMHSAALYWKARSLIMLDQNNTLAAIELLKTSIESDSGNIQSRQLLALLYEKEQMYKEALHQYFKAMEDEQLLVNMRINLALLYKSLGLEERGAHEIERAFNMARAAGIDEKNINIIRKEIIQ